ncbi:MAG: GxxExxY protein [Candidatus Uhrbacteria bacterium]|nr:GxxExxY protein [Candidatus Uhrbacteria bacterium]
MELIYKDLSYQIVGALFDVHNEIGGGHKEKIYQRAVASSLARRGIPFEEQVRAELKVFEDPVGYYFLDFLIDNKIILELKAKSFYRMADFRQATKYLQALDLKLAILATFTTTSVRTRRVINFPDSELS